jgi:tripartite-type tricarboxylate transporter receptor subunit TctC
LLDSGRLRALGVSTAKRTALMPNLPTLHESGVPGYDRTGWYGVLGPAGVSRDIVERLNAAIAKGSAPQAVRNTFIKQGLEVDAGTAESFDALMRREVAQNLELARNAGIKKQ